MRLLSHRVGARQLGPGLAKTEIELPEQALTLPHTELDAAGLLDPGRKRLTVPQVDSHSRIARFGAQHSVNLVKSAFRPNARVARSFSLGQAAQTLPLAAVNPILN